MNNRRKVIIHYHIFKNAGTSVDHLLRKNFGERWISFDGDTPGTVITTTELERTIVERSDIVAFSSHQIVPPLPSVDADVFPIVFLRDPIDRIKSAYLFEWKKQLRLDEPKGTLKDYVEDKFSFNRKSSVEEFQTIRLSNNEIGRFNHTDRLDDELLEEAKAFIDSLDFVGIVDEFDLSLELLGEYLSPSFPHFRVSTVKANVLQDPSIDPEIKREKIKDELGDELFEMIVSRNVLDEKLYQHGKARMKELSNNSLDMVSNSR